MIASDPKLILGTRPSKLALWQAGHVSTLLAAMGVSCEVKKITTKGDRILDRSLVAVGGKGLFLKEIEDELAAGTVDFAVHSFKDVPYDLPPGLTIAAVLPREESCDAWISRDGTLIEDMRDGAVVGTTSLRRQVQLKAKFPRLVFKDLRGNVDTRLKKMDAGEFDGIVLAAAGLKRLGLEGRITQRLDLVSAAGQGAIAIECRADDTRTLMTLSRMNDAMTERCVTVERAFLKKVQGSCQTPVGCFVRADENDAGKFVMRCFLAEPDGAGAWEKSVSAGWEDVGRTLESVLG